MPKLVDGSTHTKKKEGKIKTRKTQNQYKKGCRRKEIIKVLLTNTLKVSKVVSFHRRNKIFKFPMHSMY